MDTHMRKLTLTSAGFPESSFKAAVPYLQSELRVFIDQIKARVERGTVEIHYAHNALPDLIPYDETKKLKPLSFMVGMTRSKPLYVSLKDVPHILAGGYTNSGKSGFLRQLLTTLILNQKDVEFTLIDLKGGTEFDAFSGIPRTRVYLTSGDAIEALKYIEAQLEKRMELLRTNGCSDIGAFYRLPESKRLYTSNWPKSRPFVRHVVAIDEAAELFMAGATLASKDAQVAKRLVARIAALGRAVGIHLIIATQRPDRNAIDPLIKTNLQGRLCFQMADNASSMTILDSVRAADLPSDKGRAIWRSGADLIEVQVPWLDAETMKELLAPFKENTKAGSPIETDDSRLPSPDTSAGLSSDDGIARHEENQGLTKKPSLAECLVTKELGR